MALGATLYGMTPQVCHCEERSVRRSNLLFLRWRLLRHSVPRSDRYHDISRTGRTKWSPVATVETALRQAQDDVSSQGTIPMTVCPQRETHPRAKEIVGKAPRYSERRSSSDLCGHHPLDFDVAFGPVNRRWTYGRESVSKPTPTARTQRTLASGHARGGKHAWLQHPASNIQHPIPHSRPASCRCRCSRNCWGAMPFPTNV